MGKLLEVLSCTLGGPSFLPSDIPRHYLQTSHEVVLLVIPKLWLCRNLEDVNLTLSPTYSKCSTKAGGFDFDQCTKLPKSQSRWFILHPAQNPQGRLTGRLILWRKDAAVVSSLVGMATFPSPINHLETVPKCEKAAKEDS